MTSERWLPFTDDCTSIDTTSAPFDPVTHLARYKYKPGWRFNLQRLLSADSYLLDIAVEVIERHGKGTVVA